MVTGKVVAVLVLLMLKVLHSFRMHEAYHFFNLTFDNLEFMNTKGVVGYVDLGGDRYQEAQIVCNSLVLSSTQREDDYHAVCMHNMMRSLRWRLFDFISNATHTRQRSIYANAIYASMLAYEMTSDTSSERTARKACILGNFETHRILSAILSSNIDHIEVFMIPQNMSDFQITQGSSQEEIDQIVAYAQLLQKTVNIVPVYAIDNILRGEKDVIASVPRYQCDVIDIASSFLSYGDELDMFLPLLVKDDKDFSATRIIRSVVFKDEEEEASYGDIASVDWHLFSTWAWLSTFHVLSDSNGFVAWNYLFVEQNQTLNKVQIGTWRHQGISEKSCDSDSKGSSDANIDIGMEDRLVIVITYTIRVFFDNAFGIKNALNQLGYKHVYVPEDFNVTFVQQLKHEANAKGGWLLQIALGPHDIMMLTEHYVAFHMEQPWSFVTFGLNHARYLLVLENAVSLWTFSYDVAEMLNMKGLGPVHTLPIYTKASTIPWKASVVDEGEACQVVFFGSGSKRRTVAIRQLYDETESNLIRWTAFCGSWDVSTFDAERDILMKRTDVVVNIHNEDLSVLEVHRINYLLSMGKMVITERGADHKLSAEYDGAVAFVDHWSEMTKHIKHYCAQHQERNAFEIMAMQQYAKINNNLEPLRVAMKEIEAALISKEQQCVAS